MTANRRLTSVAEVIKVTSVATCQRLVSQRGLKARSINYWLSLWVCAAEGDRGRRSPGSEKRAPRYELNHFFFFSRCTVVAKGVSRALESRTDFQDGGFYNEIYWRFQTSALTGERDRLSSALGHFAHATTTDKDRARKLKLTCR